MFKLTLNQFLFLIFQLKLPLCNSIIIYMLFQLFLFQLLFDSLESFLRGRQLLLDEQVLLFDTHEFLLQFKINILHFHNFSLLLFVCLQHLLGVLKRSDRYRGNTLWPHMVRLHGRWMGNVSMRLIKEHMAFLFGTGFARFLNLSTWLLTFFLPNILLRLIVINHYLTRWLFIYIKLGLGVFCVHIEASVRVLLIHIITAADHRG